MTPPNALSEKELLEQLKKPLADLVKTEIDQDIDPEKIRQYLLIRKAYRYLRGEQYVALDLSNDQIDFTAVGTPISREIENEGTYDYVVNIVKGDGRKFTSLLGNRAPNVKAVPDSFERQDFVERASKADKLKELLYSWWDMKDEHAYVVFTLWKAGTAFAYAPPVADGQRYGTRSEPVWESESQEIAPAGFMCPECGQRNPAPGPCPQCGAQVPEGAFEEAMTSAVPRIADTRQYDNTRIELQIYNGLHVSVPFHYRKLSDVPWLRLRVEEHRGKLMRRYPELREKLLRMDDPGTGALDRYIRQAESSPSLVIPRRKNLVTYTRYWLRPEMYELIQDETILAQTQQSYPDGMKLVMIQDEVVDVEAERLDNVWSDCQPEVSDFIYSDPLCVDHLQAQDIVNDSVNIGMETLERGVAWMLADPSVIDFQQLRERARRPSEIVPVKSGVSGQLKDALYNAPTSEFSQQLMPFKAGVHEDVREIAGTQKVTFGGEGATESGTAREYEGRRNQAMMQLSNTWDRLRSFWARTMKNGAMQYARHVKVAEFPNGESLDVTDILEDGWHYEVEETIPITPGQRSDRAMFLLDKPNVAGLLALTHPDNLQTLYDLFNLPGLKHPSIDQVEAMRETIRQLVQEEPIEDLGLDWMPIQRPSISPKWEEDSQVAVAVAKAWCLTSAGRRAAQESPRGYENVIAWGRAHEERLMQQQQAPMGPGPTPEPAQSGPAGSSGAPLPPQPKLPIS